MSSLVGFIGRRYFISGSRHRFASVVSVVSFSGLVLGVMALTIVVSVMNGFDRELRQRILGAMPHVVVTAEHPAGVLQELSGFPGIAAAPFADGQVLLSVGNASMLVAVQGVVPSEEARVSTIPGSMVRGRLESLSPDTLTIVLGEGIARRMQLLPGDRVNVIVPRLSDGGQLVRPLLKRAEVTGIFSLGSELDYGVAVMHRDVLLEMTGAQPLVRLNLPDVFSAPAVSAQLAAAGYTVRDWTDTYGDFFEAVRMEKIMMFVLLSFVIAVASFSIVSGLSMLVDTKRGDIAVLRTMGMAPGGILGIFL
ncbi:MAG: ABC transporter permease, partial [Proteobacteria bacterium]|nr:ABC transporter permease [Pseudomonadota bacterium]